MNKNNELVFYANHLKQFFIIITCVIFVITMWFLFNDSNAMWAESKTSLFFSLAIGAVGVSVSRFSTKDKVKKIGTIVFSLGIAVSVALFFAPGWLIRYTLMVGTMGLFGLGGLFYAYLSITGGPRIKLSQQGIYLSYSTIKANLTWDQVDYLEVSYQFLPMNNPNAYLAAIPKENAANLPKVFKLIGKQNKSGKNDYTGSDYFTLLNEVKGNQTDILTKIDAYLKQYNIPVQIRNGQQSEAQPPNTIVNNQ